MMNVRILVGASHAYACVETPAYQMDVQLQPGRSAVQSLRETAKSLREDAARLMLRAERCDEAAQELSRSAP
jgi:hypothetical protein